MKLSALASKVSKSAGETLLEKILTDLYELAKKAAGPKLKVWYVKRSAGQIYRHAKKVREVKTLWQVDKAVDLYDFYCDSYLILDKQRKAVRNLADLGDKKRILISGIAGQGKSIFLRFLCSNTLYTGECIPAFIELRRVLTGQTLTSHIQNFLEFMGLSNIDDVVLRVLLASGKISLFLDGFDEVPEADKSRMIQEIENLAMTHDDLRIIVTSRPGTGFEFSTVFDVVPLSDLTNGEYKKVINKLTDDKIYAKELIKQVEAHRSKLNELLCTPLLVTLLVMCYKSFPELPEQLSEFYDSIFQVLLQRHDGAKPGYKRPRRCSFNDNQYRYAFEAFCYESKRKIGSIFKNEDVTQFAEKALKLLRLSEETDAYIQDIIKVTCLILREGEEYRFIHKSVQEYYTAAFIKRRSEPIAKQFYTAMLEQSYSRNWEQELRFLSEIDRYRFNKFYELPRHCRLLGCDSDTIQPVQPIADIDDAKRILGDMRISSVKGEKPFWRTIQLSDFIRNYDHEILRLVTSSEFSKIGEFISQNEDRFKEKDQEESLITFAEVIQNKIISEDFILDVTNQIMERAYGAAKQTLEIIRAEETMDITLELSVSD